MGHHKSGKEKHCLRLSEKVQPGHPAHVCEIHRHRVLCCSAAIPNAINHSVCCLATSTTWSPLLGVCPTTHRLGTACLVQQCPGLVRERGSAALGGPMQCSVRSLTCLWTGAVVRRGLTGRCGICHIDCGPTGVMHTCTVLNAVALIGQCIKQPPRCRPRTAAEVAQIGVPLSWL